MTFEEWWNSQESFKRFFGVEKVIIKHRIAEEAWLAALSTCRCKRGIPLMTKAEDDPDGPIDDPEVL